MTDERSVASTGKRAAESQRLAIRSISIAIVLLGFFSVLQGASLDAASNEHASFAALEEPFVYLVYFSPLVGGILGFLSVRAASLTMLAISLCAVVILSIAGWGTIPSAWAEPRTSWRLQLRCVPRFSLSCFSRFGVRSEPCPSRYQLAIDFRC